VKTIQRMFEHLIWANRRILEALQQQLGDHQQALKLFSHILLAEQVWFARLQGKDSSQLPLWPEVDLTACFQLVSQNEKLFERFAGADLDHFISYTNSKGQAFQTSIRDVLTHVALHGQYHRGQINTLLRAVGVEPVNVDYITYVRTNKRYMTNPPSY
jgi:uncharacterized damage-inducible protein DinB